MYALEIDSLTKQYSSGTKALKSISLTVQEGDFFALLGPNGAGKSTTIGIISSLVNMSSGQVKVFGHDLQKETTKVKSLIGLVPQEFNFNMFENVIDIVANQAGYYGIAPKKARERAEYYLKKLNLWDKRNVQARTLSGGMKRRLLIARGMVHDPKLLILDEPTAGVDIEIRRSMWQFLAEMNRQGVTIILTTHYLEEAEQLCRNIAIIDRGEIIANTDKKTLLTKLNKESLVLDLAHPIDTPPVIEGYTIFQIDPTTLEISYSPKNSLNQLFEGFSKQGVVIASLRNKANRLEELFLDLVTKTEEDISS